MQVLIWVVVGLVAGWLAGRGLEGNGYGASMDLATGVGGALGGGFLAVALGASGLGGTVLAAFAAVCCAALLTIGVALVNGKTVYARNF
jgi:uncharacterized membrane protein YeaQ/YmgE (transglycosylase-associated protein family)